MVWQTEARLKILKNPGEWVANNKKNSRAHKYPCLMTDGYCRNEKESIEFMRSGTVEKPCVGFKNPTQLINLEKT